MKHEARQPLFYSDIIIGERSEPPSDKLGGEIYLASQELVCLSLLLGK